MKSIYEIKGGKIHPCKSKKNSKVKNFERKIFKFIKINQVVSVEINRVRLHEIGLELHLYISWIHIFESVLI